MKIRSNKLIGEAGENISFQKTPNQSDPFTPIYLLLHYTAGTTLDGAVSWFMNPAAQASSHIVIGRDGRIVQMVAFNRKAWHAGESAWGNLKGMNQDAIGIELANAFVELTDAEEQRSRFIEDRARRHAMYGPDWPIDEDFLAALTHGMPPSAGIAMGFDRLAMIASGADRIGQVLWLPPRDLG